MNYTVDYIPLNTPCERRPGIKRVPEFIVVHNTGNPSSTARNERDWLTNSGNSVTASFNIVLDAGEAIECIPLDEVTWNAGDGANGKGNVNGIAIEICESGDYAANEAAAVKLIAKMLIERGWGIDKVKKHQDFSGKYCPRLIIPHWSDFIGAIQKEIGNMSAANVTVKPTTMKIDIGGTVKDIPGYMVNDKGHVALRDIFPLIGFDVVWNPDTGVVSLIYKWR